MESKKLQSININGSGKYTGGEFDHVNIAGTGKVEGHLKCNEMNASGMITINGDLAAGSSTVSGTAKVFGDLLGDMLKVSGTLQATGGGMVKEVVINGMMKLGKALKVEQLRNNGTITIEGDLSGEEIHSNGMIDCTGLLNCENLELKLSGVSHVNEIGATTIKVVNSKASVGALLSFFVPKKFKFNQLIVSTVEGDNIYLENCEAGVVRGKKIIIGPHCKIDTIEYMDSLEVDENSTVGSSSKQ